MHFHTPHIKKSEKRKASITSVGAEDEASAPIEKKTTKSKKKAKMTKHPKVKKDKSITPEATLVQHSSPPRALSRSLSLSQPSPPTMSRADSALEIPPVTADTLRQTQTNPEDHPQPRRSSRIKNSMHSVANTWTKARPYIERINGTIMPLEHQGTAAYYARDGVKVD